MPLRVLVNLQAAPSPGASVELDGGLIADLYRACNAIPFAEFGSPTLHVDYERRFATEEEKGAHPGDRLIERLRYRLEWSEIRGAG